MTKNDALLPFNITEADIGRYVREISTGEIDIVKKDRGNGWIFPAMCYEWKGYAGNFEYVEVTRATPAPLSKGDEAEDDGGFRKAIEEWVKKQRNALTYHPDLDSGLDEQKISQRSGGYAAYKNTLDFIKAYKVTPSPVAVDVKAGDVSRLALALFALRDLRSCCNLPAENDFKKSCMKKADEVLSMQTDEALTAPKPDSKPVSGEVARAVILMRHAASRISADLEQETTQEIDGEETDGIGLATDLEICSDSLEAAHHPAEDSKPDCMYQCEKDEGAYEKKCVELLAEIARLKEDSKPQEVSVEELVKSLKENPGEQNDWGLAASLINEYIIIKKGQ